MKQSKFDILFPLLLAFGFLVATITSAATGDGGFALLSFGFFVLNVITAARNFRHYHLKK